MPVFTRSVTPNIIGTQGPGAINVPIACGGVTVNPGDLVFGDDDGVVVIPRGDVGRVLELAREHLAGELHRLDQVNQGMTLTEVQNLGPRLDRWR
jgi:4-hydroxy-4-methyl-2-oxoglutarate aldolase